MHNLAVLYQAQGRYGEAELLLKRALAARERVLGPEHPETLRTVGSLGCLYHFQGRFSEAEPLFSARWRPASACWGRSILIRSQA